MTSDSERRYARYNLLEQIALGNNDAVEAMRLPDEPSDELDSLWQYVPPDADLMKRVLVDAGCTVDPEPNTNDTLTEDYFGENVKTHGLSLWTRIVKQAYRYRRFSRWALIEMRKLPVQALQILYDLPECTDEQRLQIREIGGGNYRGHPFTSARWSTNLDIDTNDDHYWTNNDNYVRREQNERPPMPAVYRDRVDLPPPTYEEVLEWDATH